MCRMRETLRESRRVENRDRKKKIFKRCARQAQAVWQNHLIKCMHLALLLWYDPPATNNEIEGFAGPTSLVDRLLPGRFEWHIMTSSNGNIFSRFWPLVRGIHRSPVNSPHIGQWRGALMFSLICAWANGWVNNRGAADLKAIALIMTPL